MTSLGAIQGWMSEVESTMAGLPAALSAAAPSGDFAAVLNSALAILDGPSSGGAAGEVAPAGAPLSSGAPAASPSPGGTAAGAANAAQPANPDSSTGASVVSEAEKFLGVPYLWGGTTPSGFDCSGLVQYVYGQLGVTLPRTSEQQALVGTAVPSLAAALPGDLVFFAGSDGTPSAPGHVGIYLGNGEMIDAPYTGAVVSIQPVGDPVAIRRVLAPPSETSSAVASAGSLAAAVATATAAATSDAAAATSGATGAASSPASLTPLFLAAAKTYGVPADLLEAVAKEESGFSPTAVSSAGAEGLMQLMPATAASLGVNPFDPAQAINGGAELLSGYLKQFGSLSQAIAAYNAGPNAVEQYGGVPPYGQTQTYVQAVLADLGTATPPTSTPSAPTTGSQQ